MSDIRSSNVGKTGMLFLDPRGKKTNKYWYQHRLFSPTCVVPVVDRLPCQFLGHLTLAKQECCFWMPAERKKQVIGTSTIFFTDLCGAKLVDRLPCQILGHLTLAKQECCSWIPTARKISTWQQRTFIVFTDLVDRLPCQISGHLMLAKQNVVFGSLRKPKQVIGTSTH